MFIENDYSGYTYGGGTPDHPYDTHSTIKRRP